MGVSEQINSRIIEGQIHGGIVQDIGQALIEGMALDRETGQVLSGSFMDYSISRADALPSFRIEHAEHPTGGNPLRIRGGGEGGIVPATAAALNAMCNALSQANQRDKTGSPFAKKNNAGLRLRQGASHRYFSP